MDAAINHPNPAPMGTMDEIKTAAMAEMGHNMPPVDERLKLALSDDQQDIAAIMAEVRQGKEIEAEGLDMDKAADRDKLRSIAASVPRIKSLVEAHKKHLTEEWRAKTAAVNSRGKTIATALDVIKDDVRKPLTNWEAEDEKRKAEIAKVLEQLDPVAARADRTIDGLTAKIEELEAIQIGEDFGRQSGPALLKKAETLRLLREDLAEAERLAAQAEELAAMKAELAEAQREKEEAEAKAAAAERQRIETEQKIQREAEARERAEREAKEREEQRAARQKAMEEARKKEAIEAKEREEREMREKDARAKALAQRTAKITIEIAQAIDGRDTAEIAAMIVNGHVPHVVVQVDL